jgi:hypothetical protein
VFYVADWEERRRAAERMGRSADELCGCALAYRPEAPNSVRWIWAGGDRWPTNQQRRGGRLG